MFCSRCGAEMAATTSAYCATCGAPAGNAAGTATLKRPGIITVLAVWQFIGGSFLLLVAGLVSVAALPTGAGSSGTTEAAVGLFLAGLGVTQLACGIGLWKLKPYGRRIQLVFAWVGLIGVPIGTVMAILILIYLFKPGIKVLFSGKPATELAATEWAQVSAVSQDSLATVVVIVLAVFGSIAAVGIIAAIAVPGLLRARMSGNEASTIGALRAINSAQLTFAASCGGGFFAPTLASLGPTVGGGDGFIHTDLRADPAIRSGYVITLTGGDTVPDAPVACNGVPVVASYFASAEPVTPGATGTRFFATNQEGIIFHSPSVIPVTHGGAPAGATPIR